MTRPKSAVSPMTKQAVEMLKANPNLKVVDAMFAAKFPESEATFRKIHKKVLRLSDELPNKNPVAKMKKTPSIISVIKQYSYDKRPLSPITFSTGVSTDASSAPSSPKIKKCKVEGVKGTRFTASQAQIDRVKKKF